MYPFVLGFGAGAMVGLLFAPKSGEAARKYIGCVANEGVGYVKRHSDEVRESALDMVDRGKEVIHRQVEKMAMSQNNGAEVYQR